MSTDLVTRLRRSLGAHTSAVRPPEVDVEDLVRRGRRARGLRAGAVALVSGAVVVAAVVLSFSLTGSDGSPLSRIRDVTPQGGLPITRGGATGPTPVAGPTGLFVTKNDGVYLDGRKYHVKLPWDTGAHVGRLGVAYPQPGSGRPMLLRRDGTVVPLAGPTPRLGASYDRWVTADGNGPVVAWAEDTHNIASIVAFDTSTMREVGRTTLPCHGKGDARYCPVPYVVSDGVVFIATNQELVWDLAAGSVKPLREGDISQARNHVLTTFEDRGTVDTGAIGRDWEQAKAKGIEGLLSYDGGWLLDANGNPKAVNWRNPAESITYRPPGRVIAAEFDTDGSVLVVTHDNGTYTGWDCRLEGACTTVVAPSRHEIRLVAWDT